MLKSIPLLIIMLVLYSSCKQSLKIAGPADYDLSNPEILKMPAGLNEISGIAFKEGNADTLYAVQDEEGKIYYFPAGKPDAGYKKFGKKGDYEDIAICNGTIIILRSDGVLFSFRLIAGGNEEITEVKETAGLLPKGEYEGMYADDVANQLFLLCKDCNTDKAAKSISGYVLQIMDDNHLEFKRNFQLNVKDIATKLDEKKIVLRPSALTKNKRNNKWYLLSSVNKLLVIMDDLWNIKEVYPLDPALFYQPEGIAFDKDNNLYISNERTLGNDATVLKFSFAKEKK